MNHTPIREEGREGEGETRLYIRIHISYTYDSIRFDSIRRRKFIYFAVNEWRERRREARPRVW